MLNEHADLELTIEGHTDNIGNPAAKPAAPNTTPEGRHQNRRVELVKQ